MNERLLTVNRESETFRSISRATTTTLKTTTRRESTKSEFNEQERCQVGLLAECAPKKIFNWLSFHISFNKQAPVLELNIIQPE